VTDYYEIFRPFEICDHTNENGYTVLRGFCKKCGNKIIKGDNIRVKIT